MEADPSCSTGGIISLALGVKQWGLKRCIDTFKNLCGEAFTLRDHPVVPKWMTLLAKHSIYKTKPLYTALMNSLGEAPIFGGRCDYQPDIPIKVAVTTYSDMGKGPAIITNYNRRNDMSEEYDFIRYSDAKQELKVYEAAAATSAAPKYFKTYIQDATNRSFVDGALYWNNPASVAERERQHLWPEQEKSEPDILLSIGTGYDRTALQNKLDWQLTDPRQSPM